MEPQTRPYERCPAHLGDVAIACELIFRLTDGELADAEQSAPPDELVAQQTDTITKSVIALGVLGCAHSESGLIHQLSPGSRPTTD